MPRPTPLTHAGIAPLNPIGIGTWLVNKAEFPTIPAGVRIIELATEAFPHVDWKVGVTFDGNDPVFWGMLNGKLCLGLTFHGGRPREGRAVMYRISRGTWKPRSKTPVDVVLDDPIDAFDPKGLMGWFAWAQATYREEMQK